MYINHYILIISFNKIITSYNTSLKTYKVN